MRSTNVMLNFFLRNIIIFLLFASFCSLQKTIDRYKTYTRENVNNKTVQQDIQVKFSQYSMYDLPCFDHDRHELQGWWDVFIRKILNLLIISDSITFHVADVSTKHIFWLLHLHLIQQTRKWIYMTVFIYINHNEDADTLNWKVRNEVNFLTWIPQGSKALK